MMTIRKGSEEQWRRFHLAHDIPGELVFYTEDLATEIERRLEASQSFDDAARAAFEKVDASAVAKLARFDANTAITVLLDIWEYAPQLRAWLNEQIDKALDATFPCPPSAERKEKCYW